MKICVYSIAKNEAKFIKRWAESAKGADYIELLDTGSTDDTVKIAKECGVNVQVKEFKPWRFDHARQYHLDTLPQDADWCIALDVDEVLLPGWREIFEKHAPEWANRFRYEYVWNWLDQAPPSKDYVWTAGDGWETKPDKTYFGDKIHRRHTHYWKHPVHEVLTPKGQEQHCFYYGNLIHHHPDNTKSRGSYFPLLKLSVEEDPEDDRNAFYYGRELYYQRMYPQAIIQLEKHLALPRALWPAERARGMRFIGECWLMLGFRDACIAHMYRACKEDPNSRENWFDLAWNLFAAGRHRDCYDAIKRAMTLNVPSMSYLQESKAWGPDCQHLLWSSGWGLGHYDECIEAAEQAIQMAPADVRYLEARNWMLERLPNDYDGRYKGIREDLLTKSNTSGDSLAAGPGAGGEGSKADGGNQAAA